jgi:chaperonin GroES
VERRFKPLNAHVLIQPLAPPERSRGGILLPDNSRRLEAGDKGYVVAADDTVELVAPGDLVVYGRYSGTDLEVGGTDYRLVKEKDLLGVFPGGQSMCADAHNADDAGDAG